MDKVKTMIWDVGPLLPEVTWKRGESLESPVIKTEDDVSWWLNFFPAGDDKNSDCLVFWLNRSDANKVIHVSFEIQFCYCTTPVRQYALQHTFETGEDVHKWVVDDVKNLSQLKIFIPPKYMCFIGYLKTSESDEEFKVVKAYENMKKSPLSA